MLLGVARAKHRSKVLRVSWLWSKAKVTQRPTRRQGVQPWLQGALAGGSAAFKRQLEHGGHAPSTPLLQRADTDSLSDWGRATSSPSGRETGVAICSFAMSSVFGKPRAGSGPHSVPLEVNLAILGRRGAGKSGE